MPTAIGLDYQVLAYRSRQLKTVVNPEGKQGGNPRCPQFPAGLPKIRSVLDALNA
jgi:hypothetical protein